jgi:hypothetical protein
VQCAETPLSATEHGVALYGHGGPSLIEGIRPLDVLDLILLHRKDDAFMVHTWTV